MQSDTESAGKNAAGTPVERKLADACALLQTSLAEAQATVRSYDTKAQIVGVGYIFALNIVGSVDKLLPHDDEFGLAGLVIAWAIVISPILMFGFVLHPTRKSTDRAMASNTRGIQHVLYIDPTKNQTIDDVRKAALSSEKIDEMSFELLMVSGLRETKRRRFLRALYSAGVSFFILFASQAYRMI